MVCIPTRFSSEVLLMLCSRMRQRLQLLIFLLALLLKASSLSREAFKVAAAAVDPPLGDVLLGGTTLRGENFEASKLVSKGFLGAWNP